LYARSRSLTVPICFSCSVDPRYLHSFPTRRSSDLVIENEVNLLSNGILLDTGHEGRRIVLRCERCIQCITFLEVASPFVNEIRKDRKSTRLNSSHVKISYAVFCLKKKTKNTTQIVD